MTGYFKISPLLPPQPPKPWFVDVWEYERGWGCKLDGTYEFPTEERAIAYAKSVNEKNTAPVAPDWYMRADKPYQK